MKKIEQLAIEYSRETFINPLLIFKRELCVSGFTAGFEHVVSELKKLNLTPEELLVLDNIINEQTKLEIEVSTFDGASHE